MAELEEMKFKAILVLGSPNQLLKQSTRIMVSCEKKLSFIWHVQISEYEYLSCSWDHRFNYRSRLSQKRRKATPKILYSVLGSKV